MVRGEGKRTLVSFVVEGWGGWGVRLLSRMGPKGNRILLSGELVHSIGVLFGSS